MEVRVRVRVRDSPKTHNNFDLFFLIQRNYGRITFGSPGRTLFSTKAPETPLKISGIIVLNCDWCGPPAPPHNIAKKNRSEDLHQP